MTATTAAFWDNIAEEYAAKPVDNPEAFERKIAITRSHMRPEHRVVDIGCGTGSLLLRLADGARELHGVDISPEMVRIAQGKALRAGADHVHFHAERFGHTDRFAPDSIDVLCAYSILHLIPERREALAKMYELLAPGGTFVSSTVCLGESWMPYRLILAVMRWVGKAPWVGIVGAEELFEDMRAVGFVDVERHEVGAAHTTVFAVGRKPEG